MVARPRPAPFAVSLLAHGAILAWVASGPVFEKPKSLYKQTIAPHSSKLVWYNFKEKLPDVSPTGAKPLSKPLRTEVKFAREIHAGSPKSPRANQFVWQPAPKVQLQTELKSPNVLAIHVPRPEPPPQPAKPKIFVPPPEQPKVAEAKPALPDAPQIHPELKAAANLPGMHPVKAPPREFVAPRERVAAVKPASALPDAPVVAVANAAVPVPLIADRAAPKAPPRAFTGPRQAIHSGTPAPLPDAPALNAPASPAVSMAIVGLNPSAAAPAPAPEGSRDARLSAGPELRDKGAREGTAEGALLSVPGLLIRGADPDSKPTLMARAAPTSTANLAAAVHKTLAAPAIADSHTGAVRVSSAPDPHWGARDTYAMSVQMPNVTSYTGSWMIWFSEREPESAGGVLNPPVPLHKVDPKYFPAAIADRVEGRVRLAAVIRKDGRVDSVRLLEHLDDRLDQSSQDALDQWRFEPALRNGQPVDVDAVFEIPFRLAPKVPK